MTTSVEKSAPKELNRADLKPRGRVFPSPSAWRDQVLYFLLPDRFSNGQEYQLPLFDPHSPEQFKAPDKRAWMEAGKNFQGGKIKGIEKRLDYLQGLGVTALWVAPVFCQRQDLQTYHGYGIQNFLEIDPRFGTRQDLRDLVDTAHNRGMYMLLDIVYNHTGNNWFYRVDDHPSATIPYRFQPPHDFYGWRSGTGASTDKISSSADGVWPKEFQQVEWYTRAGQIGKWDPEPWEDLLHPDNEFRRGDFGDLKDLNLARDEVLAAIVSVYQYWIALSDCDGFRIDTVKHVSWEASRNFCGAIREYAESIGKENFLLLGEVTGGARMAKDYLDIFGRNIDAVLDIGQPAAILTDMVKGFKSPSEFFEQFYGHDILGSHRQTGRYHVSILDDHDMIGRNKQRFAAGIDHLPHRYQQVAHAVGTQLTVLGIPCIYYGTEQAFDGKAARHDPSIEPLEPDGKIPFEDRYIREAILGGTFGAFETQGCHFFNPDHPTYLRIAAIARIRQRQDKIGLALRRGRQYLRETSTGQEPFAITGKGELAAWSRLVYDQEVLVVLNTNGNESRGAHITVHAPYHPNPATMTYFYRSDWSEAELKRPPTNQTVPVNYFNGRATVRLDLPPAGMAILA